MAPVLPERAPYIIDVEASGFGRGSYPIEIGVVLPDGTPHCFLIAPEREWTHWDKDAEAVHGISREILTVYGQPVADVAWRLNALLGNNKVYTDAWSFDLSWVGLLFEAADINQQFRLSALVELLNEDQKNAWDETRNQVIHDLALKRHRASGDARILRETLLRVQHLQAATGT